MTPSRAWPRERMTDSEGWGWATVRREEVEDEKSGFWKNPLCKD